jgi:hypothetical protein
VGSEIVPQRLISGLSDPQEFGRELVTRLESDILAARQERGDVTSAEDTFGLIRDLQGYVETASEYSRKIMTAVKIAKQEIEVDLISAQGEQEGIPNGPLTVPDGDGTDIKVTLDVVNVHNVDTESLISAVAAQTLADPDSIESLVQLAVAAAVMPEERDRVESYLADMLTHAMRQLLSLGKFTGQITKAKRFAKDLSATGADGLASTVTSSIHSTRDYRGIKTERVDR